ncbi:type VI secretion system membrane subunit TssM [Xenorhabdus hominickii]
MWSFLGITGISSIIWFIGPMLSIGNTTPFRSSIVRIVIIALLFLFWFLIQFMSKLYQIWLNKKQSNQQAKEENNNKNKSTQSQFEQSQPVQPQYATILSNRFSDASRLLKNAYISGLNTKYKPNWKYFLSRQYLYQSPWYVVIGAPHSGKTTALANSGLNFPLADYFEKSAQYRMQEMDNCHWWFTKDAVLLDTSGRYTIQSTQHEQNTYEWNYFIHLLKKYRARQPLNGVIITISVEDLLNPSEEKRDQQAYMLRRRLSELNEQLKIRFPIYIIVTKTDLLKGFNSYFSHFNKAQREQIWGFNFPWDKVNYDIHEFFGQQCSLLQKRLDAALPDILLNQHAPRDYAESYLFPQEFAALRPLLAQYIEIAFANSGFEAPCTPRGLYFTSGTQEGVPFDKVMEKFNCDFQLPTDNDSSLLAWKNDKVSENNKNPLHNPPTNQSYFLKNLMENIFQESELANYNRWWIYRNNLLNGLGYITLAVILIFTMTLFFISYRNNKSYLTEVQDKLPSILHQGNQLNKNPNDINVYALLPILNNLEALGRSKNFSPADPPLSYQMGLYCGELVNNASLSLYTKTLKTLLLPQVAQLIASEMRNDHDNNNNIIYNTLKAYQMLYLPKHYDGKFLHNWVMQYLVAHLQPNIHQAQLDQIDRHLGQLLDNQVVTSPYVRNNQLVEQKQALLSSTPLEDRIYNQLKLKLLSKNNLPYVSLVTLAGPQAELAFSHFNGGSINQGVQGMFTPVGYRTGIIKSLPSLIQTMYNQDDWVLGSYKRKQNINEIAFSVRYFYINDYIQSWDKFLNDIHLNNTDNIEQRANMANLLSSKSSPLRNLLINISKNVTLEKLNTVETDKVGSIVSNKSDSLAKLASNKLLSNNNRLTPEQALEDHFQQIISLTKSADGQNKKIPFDNTLAQIKELSEHLNSVQNAINMGIPTPENKIIMQLQTSSEYLPAPFNNMIYSLAVGANSDTQLSDIKNISKHLKAELGGFCTSAISNRYPLTRNAHKDIRPDDMTRMFAPGIGVMDRFFQQNLVGKVDTSHSNWRFMQEMDGETLSKSKNLLQSFKQAQTIRDTFFTTGIPTPSFRVTVSQPKMDNDILSMVLDVDGQRFEYSHGPQKSKLINWPGTSGTNRVHLQLNLADGTTADLITDGPWALNRLLDKATPADQEKKYLKIERGRRVTFNIDGHFVSLEFTPNSIFSPFELPNFTCPKLISS